MKIAIVYTSQTGNTEMAAEFIEDGILARYPFIQVRSMDIREGEVDVKFLAESDAVIFGSPVYFTGMSWELKQWFDKSFRVDLNGKIGAAFVTAQSPTGGTDTAIMDIIGHMMAKGMLACSGQGSGKAHNFQIGAVGLAGNLEAEQREFEDFGVAVAECALKICQ